ncbi:MAG: alpha/beta hydrolase [Candidatus Heimdallarchaeota archaeon]|nr:MAG: alpha/beta hydrolase [Candidatus Heimdallarchaeota archaeon]
MTQKSIYRSPEGKTYLLKIYDRHMRALNTEFEDIYVQTRFGRTHIVNLGNKDATPLMCLHGGNSFTPDMLKSDLPLLERFNAFIVDTIGHPGKSDETQLSSDDLSYGYWLLDVIDALQFETINIYSGSFGAGIAIRLATVAPKRVNKLSLFIPSGIANGSLKDKLKLMLPYLKYRLRPTDQNMMKLSSTLMTRFDEERLEMLQAIFKHVKINPKMPRPANDGELDDLKAPTIIVAAAKDILFPASRVIPRAKEIFPNLIYTETIDSLHEPTEEIYHHIHKVARDFFFQ